MVSPARVDALTDIAYGALIALSIVLIATLNVNDIGVAFGIGVFASYVIHVVWKMARFDPDWMTREVADQVGKEVEKSVGETVNKEVEKSVGETVNKEVEKTVGDTVSKEVEKSVGRDRQQGGQRGC